MCYDFRPDILQGEIKTADSEEIISLYLWARAETMTHPTVWLTLAAPPTAHNQTLNLHLAAVFIFLVSRKINIVLMFVI